MRTPFEIITADSEHCIATYWFHDDYIYEGVQVHYGPTEWPSSSTFRIYAIEP